MKLIVEKIVLLIVTMGFLYGQVPERQNMAVYNFTGLGVTNIEAQVISDRIRSEISNLGTYSIIERGMMEQILEEQVLQLSGLCDDASCLVEVGQILAVHYIVGGSVSKIGNLYTIEARIIDVESGEIVSSVVEDYNGPIENLLVQTTKIVASKLSGASETGSSAILTGTCDLFIKSEPAGGTIYINDRPMGDVTPYTLIGMHEGDYDVKVRKDGLIGETPVSLIRNEQKDLTIKLVKEQYILRINSNPEDAEVIINQNSIGRTPVDYAVTDTTIRYLIQIQKETYFNHQEIVHFDKNTMLRLSYNLERCGIIYVQHNGDIEILLNDKHIDQIDAVSHTGKGLYDQRWVIDQLEFSEYKVRVEQEYHLPYETSVILTLVKPVKNISAFGLKIMSTNLVIQSNVDATGTLTGDKLNSTLLDLDVENRMIIPLPFGNYSLSASAPGYLPIKQKLAIFNIAQEPFVLNFQRPEKRLALNRSLIFPGMGQLYSQQKSKGTILGAVTIAGIGWLIRSNSMYNEELTRYNDLEDSYQAAITGTERDLIHNQVNESRDLLQSRYNQSLMAGVLVTITYSWSIIDIIGFFPYE